MIVRTERLTLAPHVSGDFAECAAMWAEPEVVRFIGGAPMSASETWSRMLRYRGLWAMVGYGFWAVRETATGRYVGDAGWLSLMRDIDPPFGDSPEVGWVLAPWAHGRGLATEAARAMLGWGDANLQSARTVCLIEEGHVASIRVAAKVGFQECYRATYKGRPMLVLERFRPGV